MIWHTRTPRGRMRARTIALLLVCAASLDASLPAPLTAQRVDAPPVTPGTATGTIRGTITGVAQQPLASARLDIVGLRTGDRANATGQYTLAAVPTGTHTVRVQSIGYGAQEKRVTVAAGQVAALDFQLSQVALALNEVVITGTAGQQTRRSQPAQVAVLNTEEMMRTAPKTGIAGVLQSTLPGVSVSQGGGTTGAAQRIRIRGASSISLSNEPLVFIDGVRADSRIMSGARPGVGSGSKTNSGGQGVSRLNDLSPDDIASIEVVKGPAAATLYGADASAGVIQIITKQGQAGAFRQTIVAQSDAIDANWTPPDNWGLCSPAEIARGTPICQGKDPNTLVSDNPLLRDDVLRTGRLQQLDWSGSGGTAQFRNFLSAGTQRETGVLPSSELRRATGRANSTWSVRPNITVNIGVSGYANRNRQPDDNHSAYGYGAGAGIGSPLTLGTVNDGWFAARRNSPVIATIKNVIENTRFVPKLELNHQATSWLNHRLVVGGDFSGESRVKMVPKNDSGYWAASDNPGFVNEARLTNRLITLDYLGHATNALGRGGRFVSDLAFGVQVITSSTDIVFANGIGLATNSARVVSATAQTLGGQSWEQSRSVGYLGQWQLGFANRLFFQTGLRADRNSAFGREVGTIFLPKAGASWVMSEEPFFKARLSRVNLLRLRAAYGVTGRAPLVGTSLESWTPTPGAQTGANTPGLDLLNPGNPLLRPERGSEIELGVDAGLFNDRVGLELTHFRKTTNDLILQRQLPTSAGYAQDPYVNIGSVQNRGFEAAITAQLLNRGRNAWDVRLSGSTLHNELTSLGGLPAFGTSPRFAEGYPLSSFFARRVKSVDEARGVAVVSDSLEYVGTIFPKFEGAFFSNVTLLGNWRISAQLDGKAGNTLFNSTHQYRTRQVVRTKDAVYPAALPTGARLRWFGPYVDSKGTAVEAPLVDDPFYESADFVRLREVGVTYTVPAAWARRTVRAARASITAGGRNLALWTDYTGSDPETISDNVGLGDQFATTEFFNLPPSRRFFLRVSLGY